MNDKKRDRHWLRLFPWILPAIYLLLCGVSAVGGEKVASGGNPFFCVSLPFSLPLVARDDAPTTIVVSILAVGWWSFIGQIGRSTEQLRTRRTSSALGAILIAFTVTVDTLLMGGEFFLLSREPNFGAIDMLIYLLAVLLLAGGAISAACSASATFRTSS